MLKTFVFLFALLAIYSCVDLGDITCYPSNYALSKLVSGPASPNVNVTVTELEDRYIYTSEGEEDTQGNTGEPLSRGLLFLPDDGIHGAAYSPYAWGMAKAGHYVVLLKSITGLTDVEIYGKVMEAYDAPYDITHWGVSGHGRGGKLAAQIAKIDNGKKVTGAVIIGSDFDVDLGDGRRVLLVAYGLDDTITLPEDVRASLVEHASYETTVNPLAGIAHMDMAFSTCLGNSYDDESDLYFESLTIPSFQLPSKNNNAVVLNQNNKIFSRSNTLLNSCFSISSEYEDGANWVPFDNNVLLFIGPKSNGLTIEVRTQLNNYDALKSTLENKKVRMTVNCLNELEKVTFFVSSNPNFEAPESAAKTIEESIVSNLNTMMSFLAWRNPTQRGLAFPEDEIIDNPSTNPNNPLPTRWYVWENETATNGYVFLVGSAVHPKAYGPIMTLLKERGVTSVVIASPSRMPMATASLARLVPMDSRFSYIQKWAIGGHSLGAAASALGYWIGSSYFDSVIMWAGLLPATLDFRTRDVLVGNIIGKLDDVSPGGYQRYIENFGNYNPNTTHFVAIEGANHYYIGDYGDQIDSVATISRDEQQRAFADATYFQNI